MATVALSGIITPTNVVTATSTTTLTNKTLTAPTIASANLTTALTLAGAAGTNGQVLTSAGSGLPSWTTPSSGALTFISSQTITTTVASVDFTSGIDATYDNYQIVFSNFVVQNGGRLALRLRQASTFVTSGYVSLYISIQTGGVITADFDTNRTFIMSSQSGTPDSSGFYSGYFTLSSANSATTRVPAVSGYSACAGNTAASSTIQNFSGAITAAGVITGFQLLSQSGNLTAGTVALYGMAKS